MVALVRINLKSDTPLCGGTLIGPQHVLTSAGCIALESANSIQVLLALHSTSGAKTTVNVSQIILHPQYDYNRMNNDYGILKLANPVSFGDKMRPACLPNNRNEKYVGKKATVTGWGTMSWGGTVPDELHEVDVTVTSFKTCNNAYSLRYPITDSMLCAMSTGKDSCGGDSGGPLVTEENDRFALVSLNIILLLFSLFFILRLVWLAGELVVLHQIILESTQGNDHMMIMNMTITILMTTNMVVMILMFVIINNMLEIVLIV